MDEKEYWQKYGVSLKAPSFSFGPYYSHLLRNSPWYILFILSHYKFAAKMIGEDKKILELGCNEGIGSHYLSMFASHVHGVDFDEEAIIWAQKNLQSKRLTFQLDNFLGKIYGEYQAVVSYDVIEHIFKKNENAFMRTIVNNLTHNGICIIGTPNIASRQYARPEVAKQHINQYCGERLVKLMSSYFHNVFLFGRNDETIHTGFSSMAHYLLAMGCYKKF